MAGNSSYMRNYSSFITYGDVLTVSHLTSNWDNLKPTSNNFTDNTTAAYCNNTESMFETWNPNSRNLDMSQYAYPPGLLKTLSNLELIAKTVACFVIIALSLVGNIWVIYVVWRNTRLWTTTNFYLVNLAVSDLAVTFICTWVHVVNDLTEGWVLGEFFCKFNSFGQVLSLVSSILTLMLISCDRFFGIVFALRANFTNRRSRTCIAVVWITSVVIATPMLMSRQIFTRRWANHTEIWCDDDWSFLVSRDLDDNPDLGQFWKRLYYSLMATILFFLPVLVIATAYSFVIWRIRSTPLPGEHVETKKRIQVKVKRKAIIMLIVLMIVFFVCWLPLQVAILFAEFRPDNRNTLPTWYPGFLFLATFLAHSNSAINPPIYAGFNDSFRRGVVTRMRRVSFQHSSLLSRRSSAFQPTMTTRF